MVEKTDRGLFGKKEGKMGYEPTYSGATSLFRRKYSRSLSEVDIVAWGITYDLAVTNRPGARLGPRAIRAASTNLAWDGGPWPWGFDPFEKLTMVDYGDCSFDPGFPQKVFGTITSEARNIINSGAFLLSMGGDHSVSYPLLAAHSDRYGPLALIQFDAHSDTWSEPEKRYDHGSMFFHAAREGIIDTEHSAQVGIRTMNENDHGFNVFDAEWVREYGLDVTVEKIKKVVGDCPCYITFDIDFLDPAFAPGTGTPVCGGFTTWEAQKLIRKLSGLNLVGADLVEVSPTFDHAEITALAAASVLLDMICLIASNRP